MSPTFRFVLYKDKSGDWRWSFVSSNNNIIADSAEGYKNKTDAVHGINLVATKSQGVPIEEEK